MKQFWLAVIEVCQLPYRLLRFVLNRLSTVSGQRIAMLILAAGVVVVACAVIFVEATSQPNFCRSCHIMRPYFKSWETSSHHDVQCITCHIPPGLIGTVRGKFVAASMLVDYATGVYKRSKPWAEIDDISCTRCHKDRLKPGLVTYKEGIQFDHEKHLSKEVRNKQLRCTSCHNQIVQGAHINVTESTCFLCHFKGRDLKAPIQLTANKQPVTESSAMFKEAWKVNCTKCHEAPVPKPGKPAPKFDHTNIVRLSVMCQQCHGDMKLGDGEVPHERCNTCHASQEHLNRYNETEFIHNKHVTERKVDCLNCHIQIQHRSKSRGIALLGECRTCHRDLHDATELLFRGTGGIGVPDRPNQMWSAGLSCASCHTLKYTQSHFRENPKTRKLVTCTPCHNASYEKLAPQWREGIRKRAEKVWDIVQLAKSKAKGEPNQFVISTAEQNVRLVLDGYGQHNIPYSEDLLAAAYTQAKTVVPNLPAFDIKTQPVKPAGAKGGPNCLNCHAGIETKNVLVNGRTFPHETHLAKGFACDKCHTVEPHGKTLPDVKGCVNCHHERATTDESCKGCHRNQRAMYEGTAGGMGTVQSAMSKAGVECSGCHGLGKQISKPSVEKCKECHEQKDIDLMKNWQNQVKIALGNASIEVQKEGANASELRRAIQLIVNDGSHGQHNPVLYLKLLGAGNK